LVAINRFIMLFHHRWAVTVLDALHRDRGAKFITLHRRLGVGRDTLRATLDALIEQGWVERNPGYGHPMRPEYVLTARGDRLAPCSGRLLDTVRRLEIEPIAFRKWSMPVTWSVGGEPRRFGELREGLPGISPRALTLSLKELEHRGMIVRDVYDAYPPVTTYSLQRVARPIYRALVPLAEAM